HRIGRTARAGAQGAALSLCDQNERPYLREIESLMRRKIAITEYGFKLPAVANRLLKTDFAAQAPNRGRGSLRRALPGSPGGVTKPPNGERTRRHSGNPR